MIILMILLDVYSIFKKTVMQKKKICYYLFFLIMLSLSACTDHKKSLREPDKEILEAIFNCPNNEFFHSDALTIIGIDVENVKDINEISEKKAIEIEIWKREFASYFTENGFQSFIDSGTNIHFHTIAFISECTTEVEKIEKTKESENQTNYTVYLKVKSFEQAEIVVAVYCCIKFKDDRIEEIKVTDDTQLYSILFPSFRPMTNCM